MKSFVISCREGVFTQIGLSNKQSSVVNAKIHASSVRLKNQNRFWIICLKSVGFLELVDFVKNLV